MTFDNSYTAKPLEITLGGTKVLGGRELEADEFSFVLRDEDGKEIQTVSNGASGGFAFDPIVYSAPGTYRYTISEVLPQDDDAQIDGVQSNNVTYDETAYEVEVTVTDNGQENLVLSGLTYDGVAEPLVITNTYEPPSEPPVVPPTNPPADDGGILQTGDMVPTIVGAVLVAGVALVAAGVILHRKRGA
ncbi:Spy0128 family protein [Enorma shizhengliae]|nr:FctA domain-containing protein [Enorma shizhengliae]